MCAACDKKYPSYGYDNKPRLYCVTCRAKVCKRLGIPEERWCDANAKCRECKGAEPRYGYDDNPLFTGTRK